MIIYTYDITGVLHTANGNEDSCIEIELKGRRGEILGVGNGMVVRNNGERLVEYRADKIVMWVKHNDMSAKEKVLLKAIQTAQLISLESIFPGGYTYLGTVAGSWGGRAGTVHIFEVFRKQDSNSSIGDEVNF